MIPWPLRPPQHAINQLKPDYARCRECKAVISYEVEGTQNFEMGLCNSCEKRLYNRARDNFDDFSLDEQEQQS